MMADPKTSAMIKTLNPDFVAPQRPFLRMDYRAAIKWLIEHDILCEDEETGEMRPHRDGDDIAEAAERKMTDMLNVPMFLTRFPKEIKAFYMKKCPGDEEYTESCDLLMPGVGEIVGQSLPFLLALVSFSVFATPVLIQPLVLLVCTAGGSMRITEMQELLEGYKREGIDPAPYYWRVLPSVRFLPSNGVLKLTLDLFCLLLRFTDQRKYGTCEHGGYGLGVERFLAWLTKRWTVRCVSFRLFVLGVTASQADSSCRTLACRFVGRRRCTLDGPSDASPSCEERNGSRIAHGIFTSAWFFSRSLLLLDEQGRNGGRGERKGDFGTYSSTFHSAREVFLSSSKSVAGW